MPTEPLPHLLNRGDRQFEPVTKLGVAILEEIVNYATNAMRRSEMSAGRVEDVHIPPFSLFLHHIEMADGVTELIRAGCSQATSPLIRSQFEALIQLEYMLERDFEQRAESWIYATFRDRHRNVSHMDFSTPQGKTLEAALSSLPDVQKSMRAKQGKVAAEILNLTKLINHPRYATIKAEYDRVCAARKRKSVPWYSLHGGPSNLSELAKAANREADYRIMYGQWSKVTHAVDHARHLSTGSGNPAWHELRHPRFLREAIQMSAALLLAAIRRVLETYRPAETDYPRWYKREISSSLQQLTKMEITINSEFH